MKKRNSILIGLMLLLGASSSFAQGNHTGGGDSIVKLPDGSIVIADPFIVEQSRVIRMNPIFENYLRWAKEILKTYSLCGFTDNAGVSLGRFLNDLSSVHLVSHIPDDPLCMMEGALPSGMLGNGQQELVACTIQGETYIRQDLFGKLSLGDQTSLLVHERLHAALTLQPRKLDLDPSRIHLHIFAIAGGMKAALNRLYLQQQGDRSELTIAEYSSIQGMMGGLQVLGESCNFDFNRNLAIWNFGGGLVSNQALGVSPNSSYSVDSTAFVGIGSTINGSRSMSLLDGTTLTNTKVHGADVMIAAGTTLSNTTLNSVGQIRVGADVKMEAAYLRANRHIRVGTQTVISKSNLHHASVGGGDLAGDLLIGQNCSITNTVLTFGMVVNYKNQGLRAASRMYNLSLDVKIGNNVKIDQIQMPGAIWPSDDQAKINAKPEYVQESPYQLQLAEGLILDRRSDPFRGCMNRQSDAIMSTPIVSIAKDSDFEPQLCTRIKR